MNTKMTDMVERIDNQESRISLHHQQSLEDQLEFARTKAAQLEEINSIEKARSTMLDKEVDRRKKQLEESTSLIRKLQHEIDAYRIASSDINKWHLREHEMQSNFESQILSYKSQISNSEIRLKMKETEVETLNKLIESSRRSGTELRKKLEAIEQEKLRLETEYNKQLSTTPKEIKHIEDLNQLIGSLTATNDNLNQQVKRLQSEKSELEARLRYSDEDRSTLQIQINTLKEQINHSECSSQRTIDEIDKIKQQKAQLRCDHLQQKRENAKLLEELKVFKDKEATIGSLETKITELENTITEVTKERDANLLEVSSLRERIHQIEQHHLSQLEENERQLKEKDDYENSKMATLNTELEKKKTKLDEVQKILFQVDLQCETLLAKLKQEKTEKERLCVEVKSLRDEHEEVCAKLGNKFRIDSELSSIKDRNKFLSEKVNYLEKELKETHTDHRKELENLANQLAKEAGSNSLGERSHLESCLRQKDSKNNALKRHIEQLNSEKDGIVSELVTFRTRENELISENTNLRQKFAELLTKAEQYRDQATEFMNLNQLTAEKLKKADEKILELEDKLNEMGGELDRKDKVVGYCHSVMQSKQIQKNLRISTSESTLLSSSDVAEITDTDSEVTVSGECHNKSYGLRVKATHPCEIVPLIRETPSSEVSSAEWQENWRSDKASSTTLNTTGATMRHDIAHRWRTQFITITRAICCQCLEGIPHFGHVLKCRDCSLMAHPSCRRFVGNTCGLSAACAQFYLDSSHFAASLGKMDGWVKLWHASDASKAVNWQTVWATITANKLLFYDKENSASSNSPPFLSINLNTEQWRIHNQTTQGPLDGVSDDSISMLIEINLPTLKLYMLAPTLEAKQRWVKALQYATSKRIISQRHPASFGVGNTLMLALEHPQNLEVNCTQILDSAWLLLGAKEGLFITTLNNPCQPFMVRGLSIIFFMELLLEYDMLLVITSSQRQFGAVHIQQLRYAINNDQHPSVQFTSVCNISNCHIAVVSNKNDINGERFVYLATIDGINILQYVSKLGVFHHIKKIQTDEPCMSICSMPNGFIFCSDNFYFTIYNQKTFSIASSLSIDNCPFDYPLAALEIATGQEYLLAFQNYGVFVTPDGRRSRNENIQWERYPLEFAYVAPCLYIVYCEFMEVVRVASYCGPNTKILTDDRNMFKCHSAHRTGDGAKPGDLIFAVSSDSRLELHLFNRTESSLENPQQNMSILKRKFNDTLSRSSHKRKQ